MPKIKEPKLTNRKDGRAVVHWKGTMYPMGKSGTQEAEIAYHRFCIEIKSNPNGFAIPQESADTTMGELVAAYLDHSKKYHKYANYTHYRIALLDYLLNCFGDDTLVNAFSPRCLKTVREGMVQSGKLCRLMVNDYTRRIVTMFKWGVEEELVQEGTWGALTAVKPLPEDYLGTFEGKGQENVADEVVRRTLPYMPPVLRVLVIVQRLTGRRPSELFQLRIGDIVTNADPELWFFTLKKHKTKSKTKQEIVIPLGKPEQELIAPYLEGKQPESAIFSPHTAMQERNAERRANRKSKVTPSQTARSKAAGSLAKHEFYDRNSYRRAVLYAIKKGNRHLPDGEKIPHWTPYQLRHSASTATELAHSDEDAQALLGHRSVNMTKRYSHTQLTRREALARSRVNPFELTEKGNVAQ